MIIRAYLTAAFFMQLFGIIGFATDCQITTRALNIIFISVFFPSILAVIIVYMGEKVIIAENRVRTASVEKQAEA